MIKYVKNVNIFEVIGMQPMLLSILNFTEFLGIDINSPISILVIGVILNIIAQIAKSFIENIFHKKDKKIEVHGFSKLITKKGK